jgi:DNA polymerase-3 subunit delta'
MQSTVYGNETLRSQLKRLAAEKRVPHAQLLSGPDGSGGLALAVEFARYIIQAYRPASEAELIEERIRHWNFPDLHFSFPFVRVDERTNAEHYAPQWKEFMDESPWGNNEDWAARIRSSKGKNVGIFKGE